MSYFHRQDSGLEDSVSPGLTAPGLTAPEDVSPETVTSPRRADATAPAAPGPGGPESAAAPAPAPARFRLADLAGRVGEWFAGVDHLQSGEPVFGSEPDPLNRLAAELDRPHAGGARRDPPADLAFAPRFALAPLGYSRTAVDERLDELERELEALRAREQPVSITDEIERIGEQTASILVVAHDQASETTRRAQERADRCIADAAANAVAITTEARQRLEKLDAETEALWRERERLLDDIRVVSATLATLADEASARFPAGEPRAAPAGEQHTSDWPAAHVELAPARFPATEPWASESPPPFG